jgi:hypothetical protein
MSSTEPDAGAAAAALFDEVLAPLSARMRAEGRSAFPVGPDAACGSYYVTRPRAAMRPEDFTAPSCGSVEEFEGALRAHWEALGRRDLVTEAPRFAAAARAAYALGDEDAEVSPFVYVMF